MGNYVVENTRDKIILHHIYVQILSEPEDVWSDSQCWYLVHGVTKNIAKRSET